ncbi:MAG: ISAzo13 family transposase, partial [Desulfobacteraceae bacterium]|nr:ISAzo13 family transposase [Desulfobacteraceae bacterium]
NIQLIKNIKNILSESTAKDLMSVISWTCKSTRSISNILKKKGYNISSTSVYRLLLKFGYSLQSNKEGISKKNNL